MKYAHLAILLLLCTALIGPAAAAIVDPLAITVEVPIKNQEIYAADTLVAGVSWDERVRVQLTNQGSTPMTNLHLVVSVPFDMPVSVPAQPLAGVTGSGTTVEVTLPVLAPGESQNMSFGVRPPASVEYRTQAPFIVNATYLVDGESRTATVTHDTAVIPPSHGSPTR